MRSSRHGPLTPIFTQRITPQFPVERTGSGDAAVPQAWRSGSSRSVAHGHCHTGIELLHHERHGYGLLDEPLAEVAGGEVIREEGEQSARYPLVLLGTLLRGSAQSTSSTMLREDSHQHCLGQPGVGFRARKSALRTRWPRGTRCWSRCTAASSRGGSGMRICGPNWPQRQPAAHATSPTRSP